MSKLFTLNDLKELSPDPRLVEWYGANVKTEDLEQALTQLSNHRLGWSRWLVMHLFDGERKTQLRLFDIGEALKMFNAKFPSQSKVNKQVQATQDWLSGKIDDVEANIRAKAADKDHPSDNKLGDGVDKKELQVLAIQEVVRIYNILE